LFREWEDASGFSGRILFFVLICLCCPSWAVEPIGLEKALVASDSLGLAESRTWRRLLHFESGEETSSILANNFFLSPEGRVDPKAELTATLSAYFHQDVDDDSHPKCRFPARYYWLSHQFDLPDYQLRDQCDNLEAWGFFEKTNSVSVLMVSGYLGNPASTFGHSLLKLNRESSPNVPSLSDLTVNFGATVPSQENPILYMFRGLTGGYEAGFLDKKFYTQDLVYSRTEFRDMWEFRLGLTEYERTLLGLHLWEIIGQEYKYYFLDRNCGYRLAELLDLVIEEDLLDHKGWWYVPVDLFHTIDEINRSRMRSGQPKLITSVSYIPSARRKLYHALSDLDDMEIRILNQLLDEGSASIDRLLNGVAMDRQIEILNGLLAYHHYRQTAEGPDLSVTRRADQDQALLARLRRPAQSVTPPNVPYLSPPTFGFRPMAVGLSAGLNPVKDLLTLFTWSPYKQESVGHNIMEGGELVVADVEIGVGDRFRSLFLSRLDLVRLLNLSTMPMRIIKDRGLSWRLRIGVDREFNPSSVAYDGVFLLGAGRAWKATHQLTGFGMLNVELHTQGTFIRVGPELRLLANLSNLRATVGLDLMSLGYAGDFLGRVSWRILYRLSENQSLDVEHRRGSEVTTVGICRYF
tara:strand:- start:1739 stop:3646 length:1908 start_codon:yes stop_codon:yes gene_type:complete